MKKQFLLFATTLTIASSQAQIVPVRLNFGSHNETNDTFHYTTNPTHFQFVKGIIQQISDTMTTYQAKWNMQVESNFIRGVLINDAGATSVNDILQTVNNSPYVEVDPHNHFDTVAVPGNPYNATDLIKLMDSCGVSPLSATLGGFIYYTQGLTHEDWTQFHNSVAGYAFPNYTWRPNVIWGAGSPGHTNDFYGSGIWKPKGATTTTFKQHDPASNLTCIGTCGEDFTLFDTTQSATIINNLIGYINYINAHACPSDTFYTLTIMMNFKHFGSPGYVQKVGEIARAMQPYVASGHVIWQTHKEKYDTWTANHTATDSFLVMCNGITLTTAPQLPTHQANLVTKIYPNPNHDGIVFMELNDFSKEIRYQVFDILGQQVANNQLLTNYISLGHLPKGIYTILLHSEKGQTEAHKIVLDKD